MPGIKVDKGTVPLPGFPGEKLTQGLDGLAERLASTRSWARASPSGARSSMSPRAFPRHRRSRPTRMRSRATRRSPGPGLVPIVEPEVLMDGDHSLAHAHPSPTMCSTRCSTRCTGNALRSECMLLKPNMVVPGAGSPEQASPGQVAQAHARVPAAHVPAAVPGIDVPFRRTERRGGDRQPERHERLAKHPWVLSFSYGRALQAPALKAWQGRGSNGRGRAGLPTGPAQQALYKTGVAPGMGASPLDRAIIYRGVWMEG